MAYADDDFEEPPHLKRLRLLVTVLIVVLIIGVLAIAATIVIRLGLGVGDGAEAVQVGTIALPAEGEVIATGQGDGTVLFVLRGVEGDETLHVYDSVSGELLSVTDLARCETPPCP